MRRREERTDVQQWESRSRGEEEVTARKRHRKSVAKRERRRDKDLQKPTPSVNYNNLTFCTHSGNARDHLQLGRLVPAVTG